MKVAVLASSQDGRILLEILQTFAESGIDAFGMKIREGWQSLPRAELAARFQKADHHLIIIGAESLSSSWLSFEAGFGAGGGMSIALYRTDASLALPPFLSGLPVLDGRQELSAYYVAEKAEWLVQEERRAARATLLEMGISCHAESLAQCVRDGDTRAVDLFLRAGFIPDARDKHGVPLLCLAARSKHFSVAQLLLERGAELDVQSEDRGYSPLMDAVLAGSIELAELFLAKGADPDLASKDGQTALVVAVGRSDAATTRLLLDYGADAEIPDKLGLSARKYAALFKVPAVAALFGILPPQPPSAASPGEGGAP